MVIQLQWYVHAVNTQKLHVLKVLQPLLNPKQIMCKKVKPLKRVDLQQPITDVSTQDYCNIQDYCVGSFFTGYSKV